jgi:hypothetical protein
MQLIWDMVLSSMQTFKMKLLLENWRRYLLTEGMMTVDDLPDDVYIRIEKEGTHEAAIKYVDRQGNQRKSTTHPAPWGIVRIQSNKSKSIQASGPTDGPCGEAWRVSQSGAATGWGPLLYDVAMEYASMNGGGLTPDRGSVSPAAKSVWHYYLNNRTNVSNHQLDDLDNTLTNINSDNCAHEADGWGTPDASQLKKSPLSKRYTKTPDTINKLKQIKKLWYPYLEFME